MISLSSIVKAKQLIEMPIRAECQSVKHSEPAPSSQDVQTFSTEESSDQKEFILRQAIKKANLIEGEASKRADGLIENAMKSSRAIMEDAEKKGYEEGYLRGLVEGASASEKAAEDVLQEIAELAEFLKAERKELLLSQEEDILAAAFEIAQKIMKQHVQTDETAIQKMLEEIMLENEAGLKIYISEFQKTLDLRLDKSIIKKMRNVSKEAKLVLIKEEDLIMGETERGIMDMSVPVQLDQLKKAVDHAK